MVKKIIVIILVLFFVRGIVFYWNDVGFSSIFSTNSDLAIIKDDISKLNNDISSTTNKFFGQNLEKIKSQIFTPSPLKSTSKDETNNSAVLTQQGVLDSTNKARIDNKEKSLTFNKTLNAIALKKTNDMFEKGYFEHISPSGVGVSDLAKEAGYEYVILGENLASGDFKDDEALVDAWMASPGHRANILNSRFQEIGIAVKKGKFKGEDVWLAVQTFGTPLSACPAVDQSLKMTIENNTKIISDMEKQLQIVKNNIDKLTSNDKQTNSQMLDLYNQLVAKYNDLVNETKIKVSTYNKEVKEFNSCVGSN
ncbi:MAG: CAP domain-containing protein [Candidatus Paceibacterota bacterium]